MRKFNYIARRFSVNREDGTVHFADAAATFKILTGNGVEWLFFGSVPLDERGLALAGAEQAVLDDAALDAGPVKAGAVYMTKPF